MKKEFANLNRLTNEEILEEMQWMKDFRIGGCRYANRKSYERKYKIKETIWEL